MSLGRNNSPELQPLSHLENFKRCNLINKNWLISRAQSESLSNLTPTQSQSENKFSNFEQKSNSNTRIDTFDANSSRYPNSHTQGCCVLANFSFDERRQERHFHIFHESLKYDLFGNFWPQLTFNNLETPLSETWRQERLFDMKFTPF